MAAKNQDNTTTKQLSMRKIHTNELHAKLSHPREDMMGVTAKKLQYRIKGTLEVCEDYIMAKIEHKLLHKVAEEQYLNPGKTIYLDISPQKKPSYGGSKYWILLQDSATKQKWSLFTKAKEVFMEKITLS